MKHSVYLIHLCTTFFMTGAIWFVQIVHYPLLPNIGIWSFVPYKYASLKATLFLIALPMLIELVTGLWLLGFTYPPKIKKYLKINAFLLLTIWLLSFIVDLALNLTLIYKGQNPLTQNALIITSWVRTAAWSVRALILFVIARKTLNVPDTQD